MSERIALLAQADLLQLISGMLAPPGPALRRTLEEVPDLEELIQAGGMAENQALSAAYRDFREQAAATLTEPWEAEYNRLFEGNVACPINESGFIRRDKGVILGDIAGFYNAFGFKLHEQASEKADHLRCELEFTAFLLVMLANAETSEARGITYDALAGFCFDHLGEWLPLFCTGLANNTALQLYAMLAQWLGNAWQAIAEANRLPVPPAGGEPPAEEEMGSPYECDMATA